MDLIRNRYVPHYEPSWPYCEERIQRCMARGINPNPTYISIYRSYISWFDQKSQQNLMVDEDNDDDPRPRLETRTSVEGTVFVTQSNVDLYFSTHVALVPTGSTATTKRKFTALNWFLTRVEDRSAEPLFYSNLVNLALADQHEHHLAYCTTNHAGTDPHKGLKDPISFDEQKRIAREILDLRHDSFDLHFAFTWGINAGVRGGSSRKVTLSDLNLSYAFGPEDEPPLNRTLLLIMKKGPMHKDRFTTDKQVGAQRHRDYQKCTVFATAALVLLKLRDLGPRINFRRDPNPRIPADWWSIPLNRYDNYQSESSSMRRILIRTGLLERYSKLTHHRTMMVQIAGSRGLTPSQISTMTKHLTEKIHSAYMPEAELETLKVMSGFKKSETRFVKTEHAELPYNPRIYIQEFLGHFLDGHYNRYLAERESVHGDKSTCCTTFLLHVIPYFMETVIQCGFWFIRDFPNHPLTNILRMFPGYDNWAPEARRRAKVYGDNRTDNYVNKLHTDVATVIGSLQQEVASLRTQMVAQDRSTIQTLNLVQDLCTTVRTTVNNFETRQGNTNRLIASSLERIMTQQQEIMNRLNNNLLMNNIRNGINNPNYDDDVNSVNDNNNNNGNDNEVNDNDSLSNADELENDDDRHRSIYTQQTRRAARLGQNAFDRMLNNPRKPSVPAAFPDSWNDLIREWQRNDLETFVRVKTSTFGCNKLVGRFTKRLRAIRILRNYITTTNLNIDDLEAASRLDVERIQKNMTLSSHVIYYLRNSNIFKRRIRRHD